MRLPSFNSLDGLRQSIVARLGHDRRAGMTSMGDTAEQLSPMIDQLLLAEARHNEERIALVRALLAGLYIVFAVTGRVMHGTPSPATILMLSVWCAASLLLYRALSRGWYSVQLRRVVPLGDAAAILVGSWLVSRSVSAPNAGVAAVVDPHVALAANVGLLCAFLVLTGAVRLTVDSARVSSALAAAVFLIVAFAIVDLPWLSTVAILAGLWALSGLTRLMIDATHRVVATEVGRMAMERHIERARARVAEAQAASAAREEVLRIVAHDLRNPLGTLLMSAEMLIEPSVSDAARAKFTAMVKKSGANMNRMIEDLLNVARMERGKLDVELKPVAPERLISAAAEAMRPLAQERSLTIVEEFGGATMASALLADASRGSVGGALPGRRAEAVSRAVGVRPLVTALTGDDSASAGVGASTGLPLVNADAERIGQVFSNLIGNAIKFTPAGGGITLRADVADGKVWFSVTDTGPGIPAEQLERVFGEFWQARKSDRRGIGLGLTIAKGIVDAHGGTIGVSSEVGVGTRFWFGIPIDTDRPLKS